MNCANQLASVKKLEEKADSIAATTKDPQLTSEVSQLVSRYHAVADSFKDLGCRCETSVAEHQGYQDSCQDMRDWLNGAQDKLIACADIRGDRHTLEAKKQEDTGAAGHEKHR